MPRAGLDIKLLIKDSPVSYYELGQCVELDYIIISRLH